MDMFGFWKKKEKEVPGVKCAKCGSENPAEAKFCLGCGANMEEQKSMKAKTDEATEITEDFKDKGGFWAKIIPGYHGYKKKEIRREADKLLRDHLVNRLAEAKKDINSIMEEAVESQPDILGKLEDMLTELDTFLKKIQHADYGFAGMFGSDKVKEPELDKLIEFDRNVVEVVEALRSAIKSLGENLEEGPTLVKEIRSNIKDAIAFYAKRDDYIKGWKAN